MAIFSKRRNSSAQPPVSRSTASAAAAAASAATRATPNAALSSAAAAAALRSITVTPELVGNIQTKRMVRRGSVSSVASGSVAGGAPQRAGLQRTNSSGSMTERTFRTTSPSPSRASGPQSPTRYAPPVPPIPKTLRSGPLKRASSTEPRGAPARMMSPTPMNGNRSASVDRVNLAQRARNSQLSNLPESELESRQQRSSVNFSRPRFSPEPTAEPRSPVPSQRKGGWSAGPVGAVPNPISSSATPSINETVAMASGKGAKSKTAPAPIQTGNQEYEPVMVYDPNSRTFVQSSRPKPAQVEPPSPIVDTIPALKPGEYDPATRSIVPLPKSAQVTAGKDELEPPPRNPARLSPDRSPQNSPRPAGLLHKQPSVVREDPIAEREAEEAASPISSARPTTSYQTGPSKTYAQPARSHQRSASLDVPRADGDPRGRGGSLSPSRSTRFSATPMLGGARHEPRRGVSPVKSAMKHSPSSSIRTASPVATFSPVAAAQSAPSDVSDSTSMTSAEGLSSGKKRRSVRVSFDDEPHEKEPVPPLPESAVATKPAPVVVSDDDADDTMKPRPALPSFGSVRRNRVQNDVPEKVTESSLDQGRVTPEPAVAAPAQPQPAVASTEPLAPEVTSKEAAPPAVDEEATIIPPINTIAPAAIASPPSPVTGTAPTTALPPSPVTIVTNKRISFDKPPPAINLHPPTPGIDEATKEIGTDDEAGNTTDKQELQSLAQGVIFYGDESDDSRKKPAPVPQRKDSDADVYADAPESQSGDQAGFASLDAIVESPVSSPTRATAPHALTSPDSPIAVQSDKGSPPSPTKDWSAAGAHWSNVRSQQKANAERAALSSEDESRPKRSFFKRNKKTKEVKDSTPAAVPINTAVPAVTSPESPSTPIKQTSSVQKTAPATAPALQPSPVIETRSPANALAQPIKSALKKNSLRNAPQNDDAVHMPRTMRGTDVPTGRPKSMSNASRTSAPVQTARPMSTGQYNAPPAPVSVNTQQRQANPVTKAKAVKDESDSDSSFKKKRKGASAVDASGRYNMRRSMRAGSVDSRMSAARPVDRESAQGRTSSPIIGTRTEPFRQSLRPDNNARTLRSAPQQKSSRSTNMASRFKSRFVDSDDEDEEPRHASRPLFRSRFADSDEEDDTIAEELPPVRGIPRRNGQEDGDSTDLEDESDLASAPNSPPSRKARGGKIVVEESDVDKAMDAARRKLGLGKPTSAPISEGNALSKGTMRDRDNDKVLIPPDMMSEGSTASARKKKRGFMGSILRRNRASSQSIPQTNGGTSSPAVRSPLAVERPNPLAEEEVKDTAPPSPSAKLTRRASNQPPKLQRGNSGLSTATAPAATSRTADHENWPLPPPIPEDRLHVFKSRDGERPQTSDEAVESTRPMERPQNRRSLSARVGFTDEAIARSERGDSERGDGEPVYSQRTGKKKKFSMLRRAFGLYD